MGEIDIIEYVNSTVFTQNPCEFGPRSQTGTTNFNDCDQNDPAGAGGCDTYGGLLGTDCG